MNRAGQVLLVTLNEAAVVPFISEQLKNLNSRCPLHLEVTYRVPRRS